MVVRLRKTRNALAIRIQAPLRSEILSWIRHHKRSIHGCNSVLRNKVILGVNTPLYLGNHVGEQAAMEGLF